MRATGILKASLFGAATGLAVAAALIGCPAGTGAQVNAADAVAEDWTNAACALLEGQPAGQPFVDIACTGILLVEGTIGQLTAEGGVLASAAPSTKTVVLRHVPADQAAIMLSRHPKK